MASRLQWLSTRPGSLSCATRAVGDSFTPRGVNESPTALIAQLREPGRVDSHRRREAIAHVLAPPDADTDGQLTDRRVVDRAGLVCGPHAIRVCAVREATHGSRPVRPVGRHRPVHAIPFEHCDALASEADTDGRDISVDQVRSVRVRGRQEESEKRVPPELPAPGLAVIRQPGRIVERKRRYVEPERVYLVSDEVRGPPE